MVERLLGPSARLAGLVVGGVKWVSKLRGSSSIIESLLLLSSFFLLMTGLVGWFLVVLWLVVEGGGIVDIFFIAILGF